MIFSYNRIGGMCLILLLRRYIRIAFTGFLMFFSATNGFTQTGIADSPLSIGVSAGYSLNFLYISETKTYSEYTEWKEGHGAAAAFVLRYRIYEMFSIQTEALYIQKNYRVWRTSPGMPMMPDNTTNHFLELPLLAHISMPVSDIWSVFVNGGAYIGWWAYSHRKGVGQTVSADASSGLLKLYEFDGAYEFDEREDNRFEYGLCAGAGVAYNFEKFGIYFEGRYNFGLSDMRKNSYNEDVYHIPSMNDTVTIRIGFITSLDFGG